MSEEMENKSLSSSENQSQEREGGREGYSRPSGYQKDYHSGGRPQRPRIHTQRAYSSDRGHSQGEGGFRPEGFGAGLQSGGEQSGYQSRQQGGYQPRQGGYQPRQQGGYRPRYNNNNQEEGGYQPRQGGYQPRRLAGNGPRYNNNTQEKGG
ncbi:MAG: hypothetical protein KIG92_09400 [Prevotella sp.]|nr:hypothetical protein [Prevotella sp.]